MRVFDPGLSKRHLPPLQARTLVWGMLGGATGYALLAAFRIGVPSHEASLIWRLLGGMVFGAVAGIAAGLLIPMLEILILFWRPRRAA